MTSPMHPLPLETPSATLAAGRHGREPDEARDQANRDPGRPLSIALYGQFGCGNLGNEGSLEAMLGVLRRDVPQAAAFLHRGGPGAGRRSTA